MYQGDENFGREGRHHPRSEDGTKPRLQAQLNFGFKGKLTDLTAYRMREKSHLSVVSEGDDPNQMPLPLFDK